MKKTCIYALLFSCFHLGQVFSLSISPENANKIGEKIWKNECAGSIEGLTNWKKGENFASLGIGHFIWYSHEKKERFQETFPDLLVFLEKNGAVFPCWLKTTTECPWNSREDFYEKIDSLRMQDLRQFLFDTRNLQAIFIANRLDVAFTQILNQCLEEEKSKVMTLFTLLTEDANGLYALIDYLNFKGAGVSPDETYKGQGWGLLQVLQNMSGFSSQNLLTDFIHSAKSILNQRVENSPPERNENQWIKGWFNRLDTYLAS